MDNAFLDSSALMKLYRKELGSTWMTNFVAGYNVILSELALFEAANVIWRWYADGKLSRTDAIDLVSQLKLDVTSYNIVPLGGNDQLTHLIDLLFNLALPQRIRTLDSIHLTAAEMVLENLKIADPKATLVFVSADVQLLRIAQARGFKTENPEDHP